MKVLGHSTVSFQSDDGRLQKSKSRLQTKWFSLEMNDFMSKMKEHSLIYISKMK
jgi:hypothetical protein